MLIKFLFNCIKFFISSIEEFQTCILKIRHNNTGTSVYILITLVKTLIESRDWITL